MGVGSRKPKWITIVIRFKLRKNDNDEYTHDKTKEVEMMVHDDKFTKVGSQERRIPASKSWSWFGRIWYRRKAST